MLSYVIMFYIIIETIYNNIRTKYIEFKDIFFGDNWYIELYSGIYGSIIYKVLFYIFRIIFLIPMLLIVVIKDSYRQAERDSGFNE